MPHTFSSTAPFIRLSTHTIQPRSITSPTSPKAHGSDGPTLFSCVRTARKYSRNHFVTKSKRRLSFSVIFGRSDLISLSKDARNAAAWPLCDDKGHKVCGCRREEGCARLKQDSMNVRASPRNAIRASGVKLSLRATSSSFLPFCLFWRLTRSITAPGSLFRACCRCRTKGCEEEEDALGAVGPASPSVGTPEAPETFFGFNRTEMVVPKRE